MLENSVMQDRVRVQKNREKKKELEQNAQYYKDKYDQDRKILSKYDDDQSD